MLDLRIELCAEQDDDRGHPHPHHETDRGTKGTVRRVIICELAEIPRQQSGAAEPCERCEHAADRQPLPARLSAARGKAVEHCQSDNDKSQQKRPSRYAEQHPTHAAEADISKHQRQDDDGADCQQNGCDGSNCECQRNEIELDKAALLFCVIDDVERIHNGLHAGISAPQCESEPEDEPKAELRVPLGDQAVHLLLQNVDSSAGQETRDKREMLIDRRCFREQTVQRDEGGDGGEHREQAIEHHPCCYCEQTVFADLLIRPPQYVLPARPWDLPGRSCLTSAARLVGSLMLNLMRLVRAACRSHCARRRSTAAANVAAAVSGGPTVSREGNCPQCRIAQKRPNSAAMRRR